jgi:hypothetical protein
VPNQGQSAERDAVDAALAKWRQGDFVLDVGVCAHLADLRTPLTEAATQHAAATTEAQEELGLAAVVSKVRGLVVVSQTCDIVRPCGSRPLVELAALVEVDQGTFGHVRRGRAARYAHIPALGHVGLVADLDQIVTAEKAVVAPWQRRAGCETDEQRRALATALARKRGRFAFPDGFAARPLGTELAKMYGQNSPEGNMTDALREIRVLAEPDWDADRTTLTVFFIRDSDAGIDDTVWQQQADHWSALIELPARCVEVFPQVIELEDMSAADYVASDLLEF